MSTYNTIKKVIALGAIVGTLAACQSTYTPPTIQPTETQKPAVQQTYTPTFAYTQTSTLENKVTETATATATATATEKPQELYIKFGKASCSLVPDTVNELVYVLGPDCTSLSKMLVGPTINPLVYGPESFDLFQLRGEAKIWNDRGNQYMICGEDSYKEGDRTCKAGISLKNGKKAQIHIPVKVTKSVQPGNNGDGGDGGPPPTPDDGTPIG
jgi:hypothetical protein